MDTKIDYKIFSTIVITVVLWLCILVALYYLLIKVELHTSITVVSLLLLFSLGFGIYN
jgi:hypothetical protein